LLETVPDLEQKLPKLKLWVTSGEALAADLVEKFTVQLPHSVLLNLYGSSEVAADVTCYQVAGGESAKSVPIGRPISNTEIYILDAQMQPAPIGVVGDLYVGGTNLARGYHKRPDLTAERFVVNPFSQAGGGRLYRTGDLACYRADGNIEYRGRVDNQVKLRGFRIELGEIEETLRRHAAVAAAVVVLREDQAGNPQLVAYLVGSSAAAVQTSELRSFLRQTLPEHMIPSVFVTMKALPLTRSGKVDRQALPKPDSSHRELQQRFVAPRNTEEELIAAIWQNVLHVERVGIRDNFFELGGHSMSAMQLMSEIRKAYGKRIPLAALFQEPTVEHLAQFITNDEPYAQLTLLEIKPGNSHPPFFCVSAPNVNPLGYVQLAQHLDEDQSVYALQAAFRKRSEGEYSPDEVEALATEYIRSMRQLQPEGPYMLAGMCAGGLIAFEMARQLKENGQEIALVGIFDTWNIHTYTWLWFVYDYSRRFKTLLEQARRGDFKLAIRTAGRSIRTFIMRFVPGALRPQARISDDPWRTGYVPPPDFVPKVYPGRLTVFRIHKQPYYRMNDEALGWRQRALGGVDIEFIPGDHESIFREPNVRVLAEKLTQHIVANRTGDVRKESFSRGK
jgi:thioesterase domain-containing protein/acyl carrier protein